MGFEPMRAEHNGLAVHRLNHSATSSSLSQDLLWFGEGLSQMQTIWKGTQRLWQESEYV